MMRSQVSKKWFLGLVLFFSPGLLVAHALPQANLRVSPATGDQHTIFTLDAGQSRSDTGQKNTLKYRFKTAPNGPQSAWQTQPVFKFRAPQTGTFRAQVTVFDEQTGSSNTTFHRYTVRQELQRDIRIRASNLNPVEGESVLYTVTVFGNSLDRNQLQTRWDFNSDGRFDTAFRSGLTGTFQAQVGRSSPTVEVKFPDGQIIRGQGIYDVSRAPTRNRLTNRDRTPVITKPRAIKAPILEVRPSPTRARENTRFTLDGSRTKMVPGSYLEWIIEGQTIPNKKTLNYHFKSPGTKIITLRHCINRAQPVCEESSTKINLTADPLDQWLNLTWINLTDLTRHPQARDFAKTTVGDRVRFTAQTLGPSSSGQSFRYRWDFEGDGTWDTGFSSDTFAENTYQQVGQFLTIVEAQPQLTTPRFKNLRQVMPVYVHSNHRPSGNFTVRNPINYVGERVWFTAELNDRESENQVEIRFDSDADGVWDSEFRRQHSWWWEYDQPGKYEVRMQMRDPQGALKETKHNLTILPMPTPEAKVIASHRQQAAGQNITLDASRSIGRLLHYNWTVRGQPQLKLRGERTNLRLPVGDYEVRLTVTDRLGVQDVVEFPLSFMAPSQAPQTPAQTTALLPAFSLLGKNAPAKANFVLPPGGVGQSPSPFVINPGTPKPKGGFFSGMRPGW